MGLLSLVNRASLNQRAVGSTPTRPTKTINYSQILLLDSVNLVLGFGTKFFRLRVRHVYKPLFATGSHFAHLYGFHHIHFRHMTRYDSSIHNYLHLTVIWLSDIRR